MNNCPNCGAPIDGHKCSYCGTVIFDFASIEVGKPIWISLKAPDGNIHMVHVLPEVIDFLPSICDDVFIYADNDRHYIKYSCHPPTLHMEFTEVPNTDGIRHYISERDAVSSTEIGEVDI